MKSCPRGEPVPSDTLPASADAVVIGAGMVGTATAAALAATGQRVLVVDGTGPLGGTTAAGEGNILVSDKLPGPGTDAGVAERSWPRAVSWPYEQPRPADGCCGFSGGRPVCRV